MAAVTMQAEKDLTTGIWALSQKLQQVVETTAPVVWKSFCKQQVIIGISELATLFVCFFAFVGAMLWWNKLLKVKHNNEPEVIWVVQVVTNGFMSIFLFVNIVGSFSCIGDNVASN